MRGVGMLRRAAARVRNTFLPGTVILVYHRIADVSPDPQLLCVTPHHFEQHLEILQRSCQIIGLGQLLRRLQAGESPRRAVVVTFDDGYADNLWNAKPPLERYGIPATVFVTSGQLVSKREFWWDELERLLLEPGNLPERLGFCLRGKRWEWDLNGAASYEEEQFLRDRAWTVERADDPCMRQKAYRSVCELLRPLSEEERVAILDSLPGRASASRPSHRALSAEEVARLAAGDLIEVGAHTWTHPVLSSLPVIAQQHEIQRSKLFLEEILGRPVSSFSYPYGGHSDYTKETVDLVRRAGFGCSCSNFGGDVRRGVDVHQMPRELVRDWDGATFANWLEARFRG